MDPEVFDGFRFARFAAAGASGTKLVDLSPDYLVFGMDVHAWLVVPLFLSFLSWVLVFPVFLFGPFQSLEILSMRSSLPSFNLVCICTSADLACVVVLADGWLVR